MKDQLSALIDDEIALEDSEHLLTAIKFDPKLAQEWSYYHLIGDVMRDINTPSMRTNFIANIMQAIEQEPTAIAPKLVKNSNLTPNNVVSLNQFSNKKNQLKLPSAWSVAASVAAVMFVGWMVMQQYTSNNELAPVEIAQNMPIEYLQAHQASVPSNAALFIQPANFNENDR